MAGALESRAANWEKAADRVIEVLASGEDAAVATIGDPLIYSTFGYLRREILLRMPQADIEVVPGITSFQAAAALRGEPLVENREILTIIPALENSLSNQDALKSSDTAILLKTYRNRDDKVRQVIETMAPESLFYAARIGHLDMVMETDPGAISGPAGRLSFSAYRQKGKPCLNYPARTYPSGGFNDRHSLGYASRRGREGKLSNY